jgi:Dyp-type peroxidase family
MAAQNLKTKPTALDLEDIQGLVYSGWGEHRHAGYLFATLHDPVRSRAWLASVHARVTPASVSRRAPGDRLNIAVSPNGLAKLGVPASVLAALPQETKQGMAARARILGDDPPSGWELGKDDELDVLVMVFAHDETHRTDLLAEHRAALEAAGASVRPDELSHPLEAMLHGVQRDIEHFGFADGLSQPFLAGRQDHAPDGVAAIDTGEILLGYRNAYGRKPASPHWDGVDFGANGTYLVFRKLHQHVDRFWSYFAERARELDPTRTDELTQWLAAKIVGRWKSGAPLVVAPDHDDPDWIAKLPRSPNAFGYLDDDPHGDRCPITSHVRRSNPRDARGGSAKDSLAVVERHRILRRGRSYGPPLPDEDALAGRDDGKARGLYFICLQASIARGFEFIQQTWLSNPGFAGLYCEPDPIMGNGDGDSSATIPASPVRLSLPNVPILVTVMGGGYFFLPSRSALARIAAV